MAEHRGNGTAGLPVHLIVFLAGFTFLVYEVSWVRHLSLVLGATVAASSLVLASFMAGFGVGALYWGRRAMSQTNLGRLLGLLTGGLGLTSILVFFFFQRGLPFLNETAGMKASLPDALLFPLAGLLLFLPAFLMGGVFPSASRLAARQPGSVGSALGRLYASETLGSALGGLLAGFLLLGHLGQTGTFLTAMGVNLVTGLWLCLDKRFQLPADPDAQLEALAAKEPGPKAGKKRKLAAHDLGRMRRAALTGALICGFSLLTLQVLWLRMFKVYLTNTSYTFALISSLSILGIFCGSMLFQRRVQNGSLAPGSFLPVFFYLLMTVGVGLILLVRLPQTLMFPLQDWLTDPQARIFGLPTLAALLVVFPPAVGSGYAFPLACSMYTTTSSRVSRDVGLVLMINTIGSVLGPLLATFVLIPALGAALSVVVVMALLALGGILVLAGQGQATVPRAVLSGVVAVALVTLLLRPEIRILPPSFLRFDRQILHYAETVEGTLSVGKDRDSRSQAMYTFVDNSAVIGSSYDAIKVVKMVGHFPFLLGADIQDVLVIGFGIGVTTSAIASHPEVQSIECVELAKGLQHAAGYYRQRNRNVLQDPRLKFHSGDGRHFLQQTDRKFDLISCDPTHPILGSGNLYTRDYFQLCRDHLNSGGMVSQYLPLHKLRREDLLGIMATFHEVFPHSSVWLGHYHAVLVGSDQPLDLDFGNWQAEVAKLGKDNDFYIDPYHLAATLLLNGQGIASVTAGAPINTDNLSYTEFFDTDCLLQENTAENLKYLHENRQDPGVVFRNVGEVELLGKYVRGQDLLTQSLYHGLTGNRQRSLKALQEACRVNPEDGEFPFLIRLNF